jgi:hypothetical protein
MFLDDDDELAPDGLPILRKHAAPGIGVVGWDASLNADGSTAVRKRNDLPVDGVGAIGSRAIPSVGTTLVPRESFVPFDGQLPASEDVEWWMRQVQHMQILTRPQVVLLVRQHGGERRSADLRAKLAARQLILERHAGYLSTHPLVAHYQYRRAAGFAFATNDMELASRYYFEAFRRRPTLRLLARTLQTAARSKLAA